VKNDRSATMKRLAIITTHPIQYNAPLFKMLHERGCMAVKVFYTWGEQVLISKYDPGFGRVIEWDIPLLQGYEYSFVKNISTDPGSHHRSGINNPTLIEEVKEWKADAVLVFGWNFKSHLKCLRYFKGRIPVFFRGDSTLLDDTSGGIRKVIKTILLQWVYKHVDVALYVGAANKAYFERYGMHDHQLVFAPHAIDNNRFAAANDDSIRSSLGISESEVLFLFAGKFEPKKDPLLLMNAFVSINMENAHLLFVGNGQLENTLKSACSTLDQPIRRRIHFMDFQNQRSMPDIYKSCDVFVLPSMGPGETWGLALNEAMASSRAVLASDKCGGSGDLIRNGENGYVFNAGDLKALSQKMLMLSQDKKKLQSMGEASFSIISACTFESICRAIENVMKRMH